MHSHDRSALENKVTVSIYFCLDGTVDVIYGAQEIRLLPTRYSYVDVIVHVLDTNIRLVVRLTDFKSNGLLLIYMEYRCDVKPHHLLYPGKRENGHYFTGCGTNDILIGRQRYIAYTYVFTSN